MSLLALPTTSLLTLNDDVLNRIYHFCSLPTLSRFRGCSRQCDVSATAEVDHRYKTVLGDFIQDHLGFRKELDVSLSVISGSAALRIVAGGWTRTPRDLDLYAPKTSFFHILGYLVHIESYTIVSFTDHDYLNGVARVVRLSRNERFIDLIQSRSGTATVPIMNFWSTAHMVFVSGFSVGVAYPSLLERDRALLNPIRDDITHQQMVTLLEKVHALGLQFRPTEGSWDEANTPLDHAGQSRPATCPLTVRWIGDQHCLRFDLGDNGHRAEQWARALPGPGFTTVWWRGGAPCSEECGPSQPDIVPRVWALPLSHVQ